MIAMKGKFETSQKNYVIMMELRVTYKKQKYFMHLHHARPETVILERINHKGYNHTGFPGRHLYISIISNKVTLITCQCTHVCVTDWVRAECSNMQASRVKMRVPN